MGRIKKLVFGIMVLLFIALLLVSLAAILTPYIPVTWMPGIQVLPMIMPILTGLVLIFTVYFFRQKQVKWLATGIIALIGCGWVLSKEIRPLPVEELEEPNLHVISYNVATFRFDASNAQRIANYLRSRNPDVIALQEFRNQDMGNGQRALKFLARALDMPYYRFEHRRENIHGVVIFSKFPIEKVDILYMPAGEINSGVIATLQTPKGPLGVGSVHLSSYRLSSLIRPDIVYNKREFARDFYDRTEEVLPMQQEKIDLILAGAEAYPHPLIIAGDFNAIPNSRIIHQIASQYQDSFMKVGSGLGWTYPLLGPLGIRIDYQFSTEEITPITHRVLRTEYSDHFPIEVDYKW